MAAVEKSRAQLVDEYVLQDAVGLAISNVAHQHFVPLFKSACGAEVGGDFENLIGDLGNERWERLFRDDSDEMSSEHWRSMSRSSALAAALLATLASSDVQQDMLRESARLAALASEHERKAAEREADNA